MWGNQLIPINCNYFCQVITINHEYDLLAIIVTKVMSSTTKPSIFQCLPSMQTKVPRSLQSRSPRNPPGISIAAINGGGRDLRHTICQYVTLVKDLYPRVRCAFSNVSLEIAYSFICIMQSGIISAYLKWERVSGGLTGSSF